MNDTAETIATLDTSLARRRDRRACCVRRREAERSVRSVAIVVVREHGKDVLEVRLVQDEQPVKTLHANGAHEPFRHPVGVSRRLHRSRVMRDKRSESRIPSIPFMGVSSDGSTADTRGVRSASISTMTQGSSPDCRCRGPISSLRIRPWCLRQVGRISGTRISVASLIC